MDPKEKFLSKIPEKDKKRILRAVDLILYGSISNLDLKKLKGSTNIFRVRVGNYRIFFKLIGSKKIIFQIDRRNDTTYSDLGV